jgi:UDP-N-acetylmuramoyl-tripeptide--D-alanyl-D-alanine ligase
VIARACPWTVAEVARAVGGEVDGDGRTGLLGISTDTRDALQGYLFVALAGERFDAHDFLHDAKKAGAAAILASRGPSSGELGVPVIRVTDTLRALGDLAAAHRNKLSLPIVALTGSNGKTTTKEMIGAILGASRSVLKTEGNLNNLIGVPLTIFGIAGAHRAAVIEMGMNTRGEIARYTEIARPDIGLVTNVAPAHIGMLGSLEAIADAKGELYDGLDKERAIAVVNADDREVVRVARRSGVKRVRTFGRGADADVRLVSAAPSFTDDGAAQKVVFSIDGRPLELELMIPGEHNALNAAAAIAASTAPIPAGFAATMDDIRRGLPAAVRVARRMVFEALGPYLLVDDCYNANSASMRAAIETVAGRVRQKGGRFVALLGEMRELGAFAKQEHEQVGEAVAASGARVVAAFGALASPIAEAASRAGVAAHHEVDDVEALFSWLRPRLEPGDVILVKGSRGMKMERFIDKLRKEAV